MRFTAKIAARALIFCGVFTGGIALADPPCGVVEVRFQPGAPDMQIVAWIEDVNGKYIDTAYVTNLTGHFGLGNRPGTPLLKTNLGWPYGRREMVAPVWALRRNVHYPKVMMGGICGWNPNTLCPGNTPCGGDCVDSTIAYHSRVSSYEPFYCSPTGGTISMDVITCASKGTFSKGAYAPFPGTYSLYPPRADLNAYDMQTDSPDSLDFVKKNDLATVSQATPPTTGLLDPPLQWFPNMVPAGDYVAWVELSQESDFNNANNHPNQDDTVAEWNFEGHTFLGQPSVVYSVPFHYGAQGQSSITTKYAGYSTWDGSDGVLHPDDGTITTNTPGTGAGRLVDVNDGVDVYRVKVVVGSCNVSPPPDGGIAGDGGANVGDGGNVSVSDGGVPFVPPVCAAPEPVTNLTLNATSSMIAVSFNAPTGGSLPNRFAVHYQEGTTPLTDEQFNNAIAAPSVSATTVGATLSVSINGPLVAKTSYAVAVRGISPCGTPSPVLSQVVATGAQQFTVLNGCFVATAAYGSDMENDVVGLRHFRDTQLLTRASGQLFVAGYYAFGPYLANAIASDPALRSLARSALRPLVDAVAR